jgi:hypothetical protein
LDVHQVKVLGGDLYGVAWSEVREPWPVILAQCAVMAILTAFLWLPLFKCITVGVIGAVFVDDDIAAAKILQAR